MISCVNYASLHRTLCIAPNEEAAAIIVWLVISALTMGAAIMAWRLRWIGYDGVVAAGFAVLGVLLPNYWFFRKNRRQKTLVTFTAKYLLDHREEAADELLGLLINGKLDQVRVDPLSALFETLGDLCEQGDFEMRRRIAEALPFLFELHPDGTKALTTVLRHDYDSARWRSDLRRRTIESLRYLMEVDWGFVRGNLGIVEHDEVYTLLAAVEILARWKPVRPKEADELFSNITKGMVSYAYPPDQTAALNDIWEWLPAVYSSPRAAEAQFRAMKDAESMYVRLCVARNLPSICARFPKCIGGRLCDGPSDEMLLMMEHFMVDPERQVRRPIAREHILECLTVLLASRTSPSRVRAGDLLLRLTSDPDDIIRITAFDKVPRIIDIDRDLGVSILKWIAKHETVDKLKQRARRVSINAFGKDILA